MFRQLKEGLNLKMDLRKMLLLSVIHKNRDILVSVLIMVFGFIVINAVENGFVNSDTLRNPLGILWQSVKTIFETF
jgi:hypothetical protein